MRTGTAIHVGDMEFKGIQIFFNAMTAEGIFFDRWSPNSGEILPHADVLDIMPDEDGLGEMFNARINANRGPNKKDRITLHFSLLCQQALLTSKICFDALMVVKVCSDLMLSNLHSVRCGRCWRWAI